MTPCNDTMMKIRICVFFIFLSFVLACTKKNNPSSVNEPKSKNDKENKEENTSL